MQRVVTFSPTSVCGAAGGRAVARGEHAEAQALLTRALRVVEKHRPDTHPDVTVTLNNLANLYKDQGLYGQAEPLFLRALTINEAALGKRHPDVAD